MLETSIWVGFVASSCIGLSFIFLKTQAVPKYVSSANSLILENKEMESGTERIYEDIKDIVEKSKKKKADFDWSDFLGDWKFDFFDR